MDYDGQSRTHPTLAGDGSDEPLAAELPVVKCLTCAQIATRVMAQVLDTREGLR